MIKNLTTNQILLIAMATFLLLLAAFSFYLLQDLTAPLPFVPSPPSSTVTPLPPSPTHTAAPSFTPTPTRQTSYTPFAPTKTNLGTPPETPITSETVSPTPAGTNSPLSPTNTSTIQSNVTSTHTVTPAISPTASQTLAAGEFGVTGRIVQNGTPVANVLVKFSDDVALRQNTTDSGGHYWFTTLAPGTNFTLKFSQVDNPQLTPASEIASLAWIEGTLPTGVNIIQLPDFDVSLNLDGVIFELQSPEDGATFSAAAIMVFNPIQFNWSVYNQGQSYHVELGPDGSDVPIWTSNEVAPSILMWNGTLDNGSHISAGTYWWRVAATTHQGNYTFVVFSQKWDILFTP